MKTCLTVFLVLFLLSAAAWADGIRKVEQPQGIPSFLGYVPDRVIVVMKSDVGELNMLTTAKDVVHIGEPEFDKISDRFAVSSITRQFPGSESKSAELARYYRVNIESGTLEEALEAYGNHPMVERVESIGIHAMYATPSDFYYSYQWHLNQTSDHDIDAPEAWDIETGNTSIILAILDSGTRYYHPDLGGVNASVSNPGASRGNMWINTAELNGSASVDDDGNGYVDDWIGYDFIASTTSCWSGEDCNTKDNDPRDFNGHGTHTSGIFGMITNDGYGMCGVAGGWGNGSQTEYGNGVKIMPLRMGYSYNYLGQEYGVVLMDAAAEAFYYAADNGARIASCSWGSSNSGGIATAATYFLNSGGIIFVAAGNDGAEVSPDYLNGRGDCISVAATDENDNGASFTTYGTWVDICAPGNNIYSTYHDHTDPTTIYWAAMGGTSMATPMAAGVGALIWSQNPSWTAAQVKSQLFSSADDIDAYLSSKYIGKMGAGRINAYNAVNYGPPPPPVADFSGTPTSGIVPLTVNFTDMSTGSITSWSWTFGDGGTSTAQNPSHQYTSTGMFTVSLTVTGPGGSDGETKTDYITVNPCVAPTAAFVGSPTSGYAPLTVSFTDQSSGSPTSWSWNFGDGGTSTAQNPSHVYAAGTYTVTLTVTNSCGTDEEVKTNYITVSTPPQQCDDFSDGNISDWLNKLGTWTATGGYMKGNSNTSNARTTSPFGSFGATSISCNIRMNTGRTSRIARIVFAYKNANNYRFAQFDDVANRVRIYDRVSGSNNLKASANVSMSSGVWYSVAVTIASGGTVTITSGSSTLLSYNFGNVITGLVGVGFDRSNSDFDNFCVGVSSLSDFASLPGENLKLLAAEIMPQNFSLSQNYPNPFNPVTQFTLDLTEQTQVSVVVYNIVGQKVKTLANEVMPAGSHTLVWDGTNENGEALSSGVYLYRVIAGDETVTRKMTLLK